MKAEENGNPPLANLVLAGNNQQEAEAITEYIFMAKDISNAYLVTTGDGDVLVNTGFMDNAERTKRLLAPVRSGPLRKIILTQAHADHYGGVPALREEGTRSSPSDVSPRPGSISMIWLLILHAAHANCGHRRSSARTRRPRPRKWCRISPSTGATRSSRAAGNSR